MASMAPSTVVRVAVESIKLRETVDWAVINGTVEAGELVEVAYTLVADGFGPVEADQPSGTRSPSRASRDGELGAARPLRLDQLDVRRQRRGIGRARRAAMHGG